MPDYLFTIQLVEVVITKLKVSFIYATKLTNSMLNIFKSTFFSNSESKIMKLLCLADESAKFLTFEYPYFYCMAKKLLILLKLFLLGIMLYLSFILLDSIIKTFFHLL